MGYRFRRSVKLCPGVRLNLSKSGPSISVGPRGAKFTVGPKGMRTTVGIPGTGLYYTQSHPYENGANGNTAPTPPTSNLTLGFFQKLVTPPEEQAFVNGVREFVAGNKDAALVQLRDSVHLSDGAFMAGMLCLEKNDFPEAEKYFTFVAENGATLGNHLAKYGISAHMSLAITNEYTAFFPPCVKGALLALVEIYQREKRYQDASKALQKAYTLDPSDPITKLSIAELFIETRPNDADACKKILQLAEGIENDSPIHAALLLYKAKALIGLSMPAAAIEILSKIIRKTKDRSAELLHGIRYERALAYQAAGQNGRYRADLEKLYAEVPDYEDVAKRLGVK